MNKVIVFSSALVAVWCHQELPQHRVIRVGMGILLLVGRRLNAKRTTKWKKKWELTTRHNNRCLSHGLWR